MNERYVMDAYAWIEYLIGSELGTKVKTILDDESNEVFTCAVTVAEVVSKTIREGRNAETAYNILTGNSVIVDVDSEISRDAGTLHADVRKTKKDFGLSDAYVLAVSKITETKILTGDPHFEGIKNVIPIK
jgi:predicted nucleic acid-binding protein